MGPINGEPAPEARAGRRLAAMASWNCPPGAYDPSNRRRASTPAVNMVPKIPKREKGASGAKLLSMQRGKSTKADIHAMTFVRFANKAGKPGVAPKSDEKESPIMML